MLIRPSTAQDAELIASISAQLGYPVATSDAAAFQASLLQRPDHLVLVAEASKGHVVGWIHVFVSRRLFVHPFAELGGIVVLDTHRRRGIASTLLAEAERWASRVGCSLLRIRSNTLRVEADPFYRSQGYGLSKTQSVFEKALP